MAIFMAKTWFLWWTIAAVVIVRWFQVAAVFGDAAATSSQNDAAGIIKESKICA